MNVEHQHHVADWHSLRRRPPPSLSVSPHHHHHCVHTRRNGSHALSSITITFKQANWTERGPKRRQLSFGPWISFLFLFCFEQMTNYILLIFRLYSTSDDREGRRTRNAHPRPAKPPPPCSNRM